LSVAHDRSVVFSGTPVFSTNKTDRHNITELLLKVALNTITRNIGRLQLRKYLLAFLFHLLYYNIRATQTIKKQQPNSNSNSHTSSITTGFLVPRNWMFTTSSRPVLIMSIVDALIICFVVTRMDHTFNSI
jgi:hypothetical protein